MNPDEIQLVRECFGDVITLLYWIILVRAVGFCLKWLG
jgi:hypothetical protein